MTNNTQRPVEHPLDPLPRAVVIGASSGIGEAVANKLAQEGCLVALLARRQDLLEDLANRINREAGNQVAFVYPHDVTSFDLVPALFHTILQDLQTIDILVYVAGVQPPVGIDEFNTAKDHAMIDVNLKGAVAWLGQGAQLFERMGRGHLVGISSVAGDRGRVANPAYNASKAGISTYLEALRNRLTRKGVHVLTVKPGYVQTALLPSGGGPFPAVPPEKVAADLWRAIKRRKQLIYSPWWWRYILLVVTHIPSVIFRRLSF